MRSPMIWLFRLNILVFETSWWIMGWLEMKNAEWLRRWQRKITAILLPSRLRSIVHKESWKHLRSVEMLPMPEWCVKHWESGIIPLIWLVAMISVSVSELIMICKMMLIILRSCLRWISWMKVSIFPVWIWCCSLDQPSLRRSLFSSLAVDCVNIPIRSMLPCWTLSAIAISEVCRSLLRWGLYLRTLLWRKDCLHH